MLANPHPPPQTHTTACLQGHQLTCPLHVSCCDTVSSPEGVAGRGVVVAALVRHHVLRQQQEQQQQQHMGRQHRGSCFLCVTDGPRPALCTGPKVTTHASRPTAPCVGALGGKLQALPKPALRPECWRTPPPPTHPHRGACVHTCPCNRTRLSVITGPCSVLPHQQERIDILSTEYKSSSSLCQHKQGDVFSHRRFGYIG
jgi:hypothetical protein